MWKIIAWINAIVITLIITSELASAGDIASSQKVEVTNDLTVEAGTVTVTNESFKISEGTVTFTNKTIEVPAGTVTVTNTQRQITDGADTLQIRPDGSIDVNKAGTAKYKYCSADVAADTEVDLGSYTVTSGKTGYLEVTTGASSGAAKFTLKIAGTTYLTFFTTPSHNTIVIPLNQTLTAASGQVVALYGKNREATTVTLYGSFSLVEK